MSASDAYGLAFAIVLGLPLGVCLWVFAGWLFLEFRKEWRQR